MNSFGDFIGVILLVALIICGFGSLFYWDDVENKHMSLRTEKCKEICRPYEMISCLDVTSKFWTPEYLDAIVVCNGIEAKKVEFIKEPK